MSERELREATLLAERQPLLEWMRSELDSIPKDLIYRDAACHQMCFFRDNIAPLFWHGDISREARETFTVIAGWHTSKSVRLPVYSFQTPDIQVVARGNFYNWNVTVISSVELLIPDYFRIDRSHDCLYVEGMENWKRGKYADSHQEFSFAVWCDFELFSVMWCIASQVLKVGATP